MRIKLGIIVCLGATYGCSTLRQNKSSEQRIHTDHTSQASTKLSVQKQQLLVQDSSSNMMEIALWPKGKFHLSKEGFEGEASKVMIKTKNAQQSLQLATKSAQQLDVNKVEQQQKDVVHYAEKQVLRKGISNWYWLIPFLLLLVVGYRYWRKFQVWF